MPTDVVERRIAAVVIDGMVLFVASGILLTLLNLVGLDVWDVKTSDFSFSATTTFGGTLVSAILSLGYKAWMEGTYNGQTLGKQVLGIRVVQEGNGMPISMDSAITRALFWVAPFTLSGIGGRFNILGAVGMLWLIAGLISLIASPTRQRLGDRAAHTIVVRVPEGQVTAGPSVYSAVSPAASRSGSIDNTMIRCAYCRNRFGANLADTIVAQGRSVRICPHCGAPIDEVG